MFVGLAVGGELLHNVPVPVLDDEEQRADFAEKNGAGNSVVWGESDR